MKFMNWFSSSFRINRGKLAYGLIAIVAISSLSACVGPFSERARSEKLFEQYCHEEGRIGQFIYERVALGPEFFKPIPTDEVELRRVEHSYYIEGKTLLIDKEVFSHVYDLNILKKSRLSEIGPIDSYETTIVRKSDGKVLSKGVSLSNMQGQTRGYFPISAVYCPSGADVKGNSLFYKPHTSLIENTFSSNF